MNRAEIQEAADVVARSLDLLLGMPKQEVGRPGSDLRAACNYLRVYADRMIATSDAFATRYAECFELAREAGGSLVDFENARRQIATEAPLSVIAIAVKQAGIRFCLENQAHILEGIVFRSRQDVETVKTMMRDAFAQAIEEAADDMEQETFQSLTALAAAVQFHLYDSARPLPRMIRFQFAQTAPTLLYAYRLYQDAGRADQLRVENKVVHPAFCPRAGRALSA